MDGSIYRDGGLAASEIVKLSCQYQCTPGKEEAGQKLYRLLYPAAVRRAIFLIS